MEMTNLRSFTVRHVPWSDKKPSRVLLYDNRNKKLKYLSYTNTKLDRVEDVAKDYLNSIGIPVPFLSEGKKGFLLLTRNFTTQI